VSQPFKNVVLLMVIFVIALLIWNVFKTGQETPEELTFSQFMERVQAGKIDQVIVRGSEIRGTFKTGDGKPRPAGGREYDFKTFAPNYPDLVKELRASSVSIKAEEAREGTLLTALMSWAPVLLLIGFWLFLMRQMQAGGNKALSFGKSKARLLTSSQKKVTFKDVAGVDEAKEELQEVIEFLKEPAKFQKLGGKIPKGVLLMGPPGTGKTLLARAVAGEAGVPFFSISGSDFVEMFVGVGASRVRDLFEQGKKNAPCIVFIDEIDAVGRHRGAGLGGGHDEREQTLNQLLVEMDGFESNDGVILMAATNRPDVLDPALLRPGRFDRRVVVDWPDLKGREGIIQVHVKQVPIADDVDIETLSRGTPGFSGADLANLVNEAALGAARVNKRKVEMVDFEYAKDKVMMGAERKSLVLSETEKKNTAYHEIGHAIVSAVLPHADPLHKVSIIPRGRALGVTISLPAEDKHSYSSEYLKARLAVAMGGRIAEEVFLGDITTGAGNDLEQATDLARKMVCEWGMSDLGPLTFGKKEEAIFLGKEFSRHQDYSESTALQIDAEVKKIVGVAYQIAKKIVQDHREVMERLVDVLLERESIDGEAFYELVRKQTGIDYSAGKVRRTPVPPSASPVGTETTSTVPPLSPQPA
jgi:cell division protease FtsH